MNVKKMSQCALFAALLSVCAWLSLPVGDVAFTLQTFGIFLALGLLGGKWGTVSIFVYLLLGAAGVPVFSGFRGGIGVLAGATGGYLVGFLFSGLIYWLITAVWDNSSAVRVCAMVLGLIGCYAFGTLWFWFGYARNGGISLILIKCVLPYLLPDALKLILAWFMTTRLKRFIV